MLPVIQLDEKDLENIIDAAHVDKGTCYETGDGG
jgi:hypothetical protein